MAFLSYASYTVCFTHSKTKQVMRKKRESKLILKNEYNSNFKLGMKYVIRKRLLTLYLCKLNVSNSCYMSFILKVICPDSMIQVSQGLAVAALT